MCNKSSVQLSLLTSPAGWLSSCVRAGLVMTWRLLIRHPVVTPATCDHNTQQIHIRLGPRSSLNIWNVSTRLLRVHGIEKSAI
jgi:hypothetical protein